MTDDTNPFSAPRASGPRMQSPAPDAGNAEDEAFDPGPWRDYETLVVTPWSKLPDYCVKCNEPANGFRVRRIAKVSPWWMYLVLLLGPMFWLLLLAAPRNRIVFRFGLCRRHRRRRALLQSIGPVMALGGLAGLLGTPLLGSGFGVAFGFMAGCVTFVVGSVLSITLGGVLRTVELRERHAWVSGACQEFLKRLPPWRSA